MIAQHSPSEWEKSREERYGKVIVRIAVTSGRLGLFIPGERGGSTRLL